MRLAGKIGNMFREAQTLVYRNSKVILTYKLYTKKASILWNSACLFVTAVNHVQR